MARKTYATLEEAELLDHPEVVRRHPVVLATILTIVAVALAGGVYALLVAFAPAPAPRIAGSPQISAGTVEFAGLPTVGRSAIARGDGQTLAVSPPDAAASPMSGSAKLLTALVVLSDNPLAAGAEGESIPIMQEDRDNAATLSSQGWVTGPFPTAGTITLREAVDATVATSSPNHAQLLARWAYGTEAGYVQRANEWLAQHGFSSTVVADSAGLNYATVTTPGDLARLGALAATQPAVLDVLSSGGGQAASGVSLENRMRWTGDNPNNVLMLGRWFEDDYGVTAVGIVELPIEGQSVRVAVATMGQDTHPAAVAALQALSTSAIAASTATDVIVAGQVIAPLESADGARVDLLAQTPLRVPAWDAPNIGYTVLLAPNVDAIEAGAEVAVLEFSDNRESIPLTASADLPEPDFWWKFTNPGAVFEAYFG